MTEETKGIIIGGNENSAWLIPWWWKYYSRHNNFNVVFVDFGLSEKSRKLCSTFSSVEDIDPCVSNIATRDVVSKSLRDEWESVYGENVWKSRCGWFLKPKALLQTPFDKTIWLDLDCEVMGSLEPLFQSLNEENEFSVAKDPSRAGIYNSGVVVYRKNSELLKNWESCCKNQNDKFLSDDVALSSLINSKNNSFKELSYEFHSVPDNITPSSKVVHWISNWGKQFIELYGGYQGYKDYLLNAS